VEQAIESESAPPTEEPVEEGAGAATEEATIEEAP